MEAVHLQVKDYWQSYIPLPTILDGSIYYSFTLTIVFTEPDAATGKQMSYQEQTTQPVIIKTNCHPILRR